MSKKSGAPKKTTTKKTGSRSAPKKSTVRKPKAKTVRSGSVKQPQKSTAGPASPPFLWSTLLPPDGDGSSWSPLLQMIRRFGFNAVRLDLNSGYLQSVNGEVEAREMQAFRKRLESIRKAGLRLVLNLNPLNDPAWFPGPGVEPQGFEPYYKFVDSIVPAVGDLVSDYITIEKPNRYFDRLLIAGGIKFPGAGYLRSYRIWRAIRRLLIVHFRAAEKIVELHQKSDFARPGISSSLILRSFRPARPEKPLDLDRVRISHDRTITLFLDALTTGKFSPPLGKGERVGPGNSLDFLDFELAPSRTIGFDWLSPSRLFINVSDEPEKPTEPDLTQPDLADKLLEIYNRYQLPMRLNITGPDTSNELIRVAIFRDRWTEIRKARLAGARMEGFGYYSFLDNNGQSGDYGREIGLIRVNPKTGSRSRKKSAMEVQKIIRSGFDPIGR